MKALVTCPNCKAVQEIALEIGERDPSCNQCQKPLFGFSSDQFKADYTLNQCPCCGGGHLYRQKDFNRNIGVVLIVIGVALAYFTYGISLVVVTLIDWLLNRLVGEVGVCYKCGAQFRASPVIGKLEHFNLVLFDYYKNLNERG